MYIKCGSVYGYIIVVGHYIFYIRGVNSMLIFEGLCTMYIGMVSLYCIVGILVFVVR